MSEFEVLMAEPMPARVVPGLEKGCKLHKLWEAPDKEAALKQLAPRIRGLVDAARAQRVPVSRTIP